MPEHEDLAHQNLIKDTLGIDLAESGYYPEAESGPNEPESNDFHDILSKLAKSNTHKIKNSKKLRRV